MSGLSSSKILNEKLGYKKPVEPIVSGIKEVIQIEADN